MEKEGMVECKMCCMEISPRAKKCPYCLASQNRKGMIGQYVIGFVPMLIVLGMYFIVIDSPFEEGTPFAEYSSAVSVLDTKMDFGVCGCKYRSPTVVILGRIRNDSPISWEDVKLEAIFFDQEGNLVDATQIELDDFVVVSHDASFFKLSVRREFPEERYKSFKVRVISARDEREPF